MRRLPFAVAALFAVAAPVAAQDRVALCIGVNKYDHARLKPLSFAENDATRFAASLRDAGYKVVLMTTAAGRADPALAPTKKNIDAQVKNLLDNRKKGDVVMLAFSGHGLQFDKDPDCHFCPVDAAPFADKKQSLVSLERIYADLGKCGAGAKMLLADCCRDDPDPTKGRGAEEALVRVPPEGVLALYACSPQERAYENQKLRHGVFFHHILEGLAAQPGRGEDLEFEGLALTVRREVPRTVLKLAGEGKPQNPNLRAPDVRGAPVVLVAAADRELIADARRLDDTIRARGGSDGYYKTHAPERIAAWKKAADRGLPTGLFLYAGCLLRGTGVKQDEAAAVAMYRRAAAAGSDTAVAMIGYCHATGSGVKKDMAEAVRWYEKAAAAGDALGLNNLAVCCAAGSGTPKNPARAVDLYRRAADGDSTRGMVQLGFAHEYAIGVAEDVPAAARWYQRAADAGGLEGMDALAHCYLKGKGVRKDPDEGVRWLRVAADAGWHDSMRMLAALMLDGDVIPKDEEAAVKILRKGIDTGDVAARAVLGDCYRFGAGVERSPGKAFEMYRAAADANNSHGMCELGRCYLDGFGVGKNPKEGVRWLQKAADAGSADAMYWLGCCHRDGTALTVNAAEAAKLFEEAAKYGHRRAAEAAKALRKK